MIWCLLSNLFIKSSPDTIHHTTLFSKVEYGCGWGSPCLPRFPSQHAILPTYDTKNKYSKPTWWATINYFSPILLLIVIDLRLGENDLFTQLENLCILYTGQKYRIKLSLGKVLFTISFCYKDWTSNLALTTCSTMCVCYWFNNKKLS